MKRALPTLLSLLLFASTAAAQAPAQQPAVLDPTIQTNEANDNTFSVIGRDPVTGDLGVAVASRTIAVGARVRGGKGGVAVFAHQSGSNPMYSLLGVELLEAGMTPQQALDFLLRADNGGGSRQVSILDAKGRTATWTSPTIGNWKGSRCGENYCVQGNTLVGPETLDSMEAVMLRSVGQPLWWRLADALDAGDKAGGDNRGKQSAGLLILCPLSLAGYSDHYLDLRVDEHSAPITELKRIMQLSNTRPGTTAPRAGEPGGPTGTSLPRPAAAPTAAGAAAAGGAAPGRAAGAAGAPAAAPAAPAAGAPGRAAGAGGGAAAPAAAAAGAPAAAPAAGRGGGGGGGGGGQRTCPS